MSLEFHQLHLHPHLSLGPEVWPRNLTGGSTMLQPPLAAFCTNTDSQHFLLPLSPSPGAALAWSTCQTLLLWSKQGYKEGGTPLPPKPGPFWELSTQFVWWVQV